MPYLFVPQKNDVHLSAEFENILQWAADNLMTVIDSHKII